MACFLPVGYTLTPDLERDDTTVEKTSRSEASEKWREHVTKEFNRGVKYAFDSAIFGIVGQDVLRSLYQHLKEHYDITPDEIPYRTETVFDTLEHTFGVTGARTLSRAIAKRLYYRLNLQFVETENYRLQDYLEQAKKELGLRSTNK